MNYSLPLYRKKPKKWTWESWVRTKDATTEKLKAELISSATKKGDPNV